MARPELSIVLPVYNQADHIARVAVRWLACAKGRNWEILLVPNGCRDDSNRICRGLARRHRGLRCVTLERGGWGRGVRAGLKAAKGRFLCYTNSARTDPAVVARLFKHLKAHPGSLVKVKRLTRGQFLRDLGSRLYNWENRLLFGVRSADVNGTPKLFRADLLDKLALVSDGDLVDAEVLAGCRGSGVPLVEEPLADWNRHGGKSTTRIGSAFRMYLGLLGLRFRKGR